MGIKRWIRHALFALGTRVLDGLEAIKDEIVERHPEVDPEHAVDETESWPVPAQSPHTAESRALEYRPTPRRRTAAPTRPLAGSAAARMRAGRGSE
jgi:hypothetical protein